MKNLYFLVVVTIMTAASMTAQETRFGVNAGYTNVSANVNSSTTGIDDGDSESGFYVGLVVERRIVDILGLQAELNYVNINDSSTLSLPVVGKFYVGGSDFNLQAGPQISYVLEDSIDGITNFIFSSVLGLGYDIGDNFFVQGRYAFQINNSITGPASSDVSLRNNFISAGVGYKF
jgi:hypothetical protein